MVVISPAAIPLLERQPALARLVEAYLGPVGRENLPAATEANTVFAIVHLAGGAEWAVETGATLGRGGVGILARGGAYLCPQPLALPRALLEALGFDQLPAATMRHRNAAGGTANGYVLDLARTGVEPWVEALVTAPSALSSGWPTGR